MLFTVALVVLLVYLFLQTEMKGKLNLPPGPRGLSFIINLIHFSAHPYEDLLKWKKEFGSIFSFKLGHVCVVVLSDVNHIKKCFNENVFLGRTDEIFVTLLPKGKNGIAFSEGRAWTDQRRFALRHMKALGFGKASMHTEIEEEVAELIEDLRHKEGISLKVNDLFTKYILNSLWTIVAGKRLTKQDSDKLEAIQEVDRVFTNTSMAAVFHFLSPRLVRMFPGITGCNKYLRVAGRLHELQENEIREHEETLSANGDGRDFIDAYLMEIQRTTDKTSSFYKEQGYDQLSATIGDFFIGGSETTCILLGWSMLYLASNKRVQEKFQNEIDAVTEGLRPVALSDRPNMPYSEALTCEALRMASVLPVGIFHTAQEDTKFQGYDIPKGTWMVHNLYGNHFDEDIWGDPHAFRPERFLNEDETIVIRHEHFAPFSVGKRICIGENLARDQTFLFLCNIFQHFQVILDPSKPKPTNTAQPGFVRRPPDFHVVLKNRII